MNMSGSQRTAPLDAYIQRIEEEEEMKAMIAAKEKDGQINLATFPSGPAVVEAFRDQPSWWDAMSKRGSPMAHPGLGSRLNVTPGSSGESAALTQVLQGIRDRNLPVAQRNVASGKESAGSILDLGRSKLNALTQPQHAPTVTSINSVNAGFGQGNPSLKTPPGSPAAPIIPVGSRARHHPGFDQYAYTGKPNRDNPFSSKLLADLRKPEEDEFMSWDDQMFLLSLMEGMQGGDPPTPYGSAYGGGNKAWATPLGMS